MSSEGSCRGKRSHAGAGSRTEQQHMGRIPHRSRLLGGTAACTGPALEQGKSVRRKEAESNSERMKTGPIPISPVPPREMGVRNEEDEPRMKWIGKKVF